MDFVFLWWNKVYFIDGYFVELKFGFEICFGI